MSVQDKRPPDSDAPNRRDVVAVIVLLGVAVLLAVGLLIALPALARLDPVSASVMKHRLREAFCQPRISDRIECLHECAAEAGADYKTEACALLPTSSPSSADQERLEAELWTRSPCAKRCGILWKTHALWCSKGAEVATPGETRADEKAKRDGVDACIFEGATMAVFDWREARCRERCPESRPDAPSYLSSGDTCMLLCLLGSLVDDPSPDEARGLIPALHGETDYRVRQQLLPYQAGVVPENFDALREACRLANVRATYAEPLEDKRVKERAFRDCVRDELDALGR